MPISTVLDSTIHYRELGSGVPLVFLHGNPTSSYLWRHILPAVGEPGRLLAPDLIGMGESGKPAIEYSFEDHARYLDAWFDAMELDRVVLIGHDWGAALAFDWASRHPGRVSGIAFNETIVRPMSWEEFPEGGRDLFRALKTPGVGEAMLESNAFIDGLPATVASQLSEADLDVYRRPYPDQASRRPMLRWARSLPLGGEPADVVARVEQYDEWLAASADVPKLMLTFEPGPGVMLSQQLIDWCAANIAALDIAHHQLVAGHHAPEDHPEAFGGTVAAWLDKYNLRS
jgi:haloalkane dehalogenase